MSEAERFIKKSELKTYEVTGGAFTYAVTDSSWSDILSKHPEETTILDLSLTDPTLQDVMKLKDVSASPRRVMFEGVMKYGSEVTQPEKQVYFQTLESLLSEQGKFTVESTYFNNLRFIFDQKHLIGDVGIYDDQVQATNSHNASGSGKAEDIQLIIKPIKQEIIEAEAGNGRWEYFKQQMRVNLCALTALAQVVKGTAPQEMTIVYHDGVQYTLDSQSGLYYHGTATRDELDSYAKADFNVYGFRDGTVQPPVERENVAVKSKENTADTQTTPHASIDEYVGPETVIVQMKDLAEIFRNRTILESWNEHLPVVLIAGQEGVGKTLLVEGLAADVDATFMYDKDEVRSLDTVVNQLILAAAAKRPSVVYLPHLDTVLADEKSRTQLHDAIDEAQKNANVMVVLGVDLAPEMPAAEDIVKSLGVDVSISVPMLTPEARTHVLTDMLSLEESGRAIAAIIDHKIVGPDVNIAQLVEAMTDFTAVGIGDAVESALRQRALTNARTNTLDGQLRQADFLTAIDRLKSKN